MAIFCFIANTPYLTLAMVVPRARLRKPHAGDWPAEIKSAVRGTFSMDVALRRWPVCFVSSKSFPALNSPGYEFRRPQPFNRLTSPASGCWRRAGFLFTVPTKRSERGASEPVPRITRFTGFTRFCLLFSNCSNA